MKLLAGPILGFRGQKDSTWHVCCLVVIQDTNEGPTLKFSSEGIGPAEAARTLLKDYNGKKTWRFDFAIQQTGVDQVVSYSFGANCSYSFTVPPQGEIPRIAYASCAGLSRAEYENKVKNKNRLWYDLQKKHMKQGKILSSSHSWRRPALRR